MRATKQILIMTILAVLAMGTACTGGSTVQMDTSDGVSGDLPGMEVTIKGGDASGLDAETWDLPEVTPHEQWVYCAEEGGFGCPCASDSDCLSDWCVETSEGSMCTINCLEECPPGFGCMDVAMGTDQLYVCLPYHANLCRPCAQDEDCGGEAVDVQNFCLDYGSQGKFCAGMCEPDKVECPAGFSCEEVTLESGIGVHQCVPEAGMCECTDKYTQLGLKTQCFVENNHGKCFGFRFCGEDGLTDCDAPAPAQEECNQEDDDCNAAVYFYRADRSIDSARFRSPFEERGVFTYTPPHIARRIAIQDGRFTVHCPPEAVIDHERLRKMIIPAHARQEIHASLYRCGMTRALLFPDLDGLADHITWAAPFIFQNPGLLPEREDLNPDDFDSEAWLTEIVNALLDLQR